MTTPIFPIAPKLVLFDLDDTLCDYAGARARRLEIAFRIAAEQAGVELENDLSLLVQESIAIHPHSSEHFSDLLERHGIRSEAAVCAAREWFAGHRFHTLSLFTDAVQTVEAVRGLASVQRIGLVTNGPSEVQRTKIKLLGIAEQFDFILVSEEFGFWKPAPEIFAEALRLGEAGPGETVFIGDSSEHDIAGAQAAGIAGIWVNSSGRAWDQTCPEPVRSVRGLGELRSLLCSGSLAPRR